MVNIWPCKPQPHNGTYLAEVTKVLDHSSLHSLPLILLVRVDGSDSLRTSSHLLLMSTLYPWEIHLTVLEGARVNTAECQIRWTSFCSDPMQAISHALSSAMLVCLISFLFFSLSPFLPHIQRSYNQQTPIDTVWIPRLLECPESVAHIAYKISKEEMLAVTLCIQL